MKILAVALLLILCSVHASTAPAKRHSSLPSLLSSLQSLTGIAGDGVYNDFGAEFMGSLAKRWPQPIHDGGRDDDGEFFPSRQRRLLANYAKHLEDLKLIR